MKKASRGLQAFPVAVLTLFASVSLFLGFTGTAAAQRQPRITVIDDSNRVTLHHTAHALATAGRELSPAEPGLRMERMLMVLGPSDDLQPQLRALIDSQHDKKSANYHKWLTPEQFGERFGPARQDVDAIAGWLQQRGFDSVRPTRGAAAIEFSGSAQLVEQAFGTQMHYYQFNGQKHLANSTDISIPRAMSGIVRGVSLQNFAFAKPSLIGPYKVARDSSGKLVRTDPAADAGNGSNFLAPGDYAKIYDINPLYQNNINGAGTTIAVVARSNIELSDVETFRQAFNLPANDPEVILNGQDPGQVLGGDFTEASLDAEWVGALAPNAKVKFVVTQSTATVDGTFLSELYIVENNLADIMSVSFETCEPLLTPEGDAFFSALYQQAAAQGISVFVGSGDAGAADCEFSGFNGGPATTGLAVNGLASTPFDTAVGGTQFNENGNVSTFWSPANGPAFTSVLGYIPENVWNESCDPTVNPNCFVGLFLFAADGGGVSTVYPKPSWQSTTITGVPNDNARDVPDISLTAAGHDAYIFCEALFQPCILQGSGNQTQLAAAGVIAGTSASVQAFASIMALVDQHQGGRQGLANYVLYKLASKETFSNCNSSNRTDPTQPTPAGCVFNDVTVGNNGVPGNDTLSAPVPPGDTVGQVGYNATPGYDCATGLGSVDVTNLVNAWSTVSFLGTSTAMSTTGSASAQHGQPITFNVNVKSLSGSGTPSGEFVLIAKNAPAAFNGTAVGSGILTNGSFSGPINSLPGGEYQVIAQYGGDGTFGGSSSAVVPVNVSAEGSNVALAGSDQNGVAFAAPGSMNLNYGIGQSFLVTVNSASGNGTPSGTVTLLDGTTPLGQLPLNNNGQATFINCDPLSAQFCLTIGQHNLSISYSGDSSDTASTSPLLTANVTKGPAQFGTLFSCCIENQTVQIGADFSTGTSILGIPPSGTISFADTFNGVTSPLGTPVAVTPGAIIFRAFNVAGGTHVLTLNYSGDANYLPSSVSSAPLPTNPLPNPGTPFPIVTLSTSTNPIVEGQPITITVNVSAPPNSTVVPTGTFFVMAGDAFVNPISGGFTLQNGSLTFIGIMPNTANTLQAFYNGDNNYSPIASAPIDISVAKIDAALSVSANQTNVQAETSVNLLASLTGPTGSQAPQGIVQFFDSLNGGPALPVGAAQLLLTTSSGTNFDTTTTALSTTLPVGTNTITISYTGDTNYNPITEPNSAATAVVVNSGPPALFGFATLPGGNIVSITKKQTAQFNVFLNANGFVGTVGLKCAGAPPGMTCSVNPASVELTADVTSVPFTVTIAPSPKVHGQPLKNLRHFTITVTGTDGASSSSTPLILNVKP